MAVAGAIAFALLYAGLVLSPTDVTGWQLLGLLAAAIAGWRIGDWLTYKL